MQRILIVVMAILTLGTGCHVSRPTTAEVPVDTRVTIEFSEPTLLMVRTGAPDPVPLEGVTELRGRVEYTTADTAFVRVAGASGPSLAFREVPINGIAAVARQPGTSFGERQFSGKRTTALVLGTAAMIGLALLAWVVVFFNPA